MAWSFLVCSVFGNVSGQTSLKKLTCCPTLSSEYLLRATTSGPPLTCASMYTSGGYTLNSLLLLSSSTTRLALSSSPTFGGMCIMWRCVPSVSHAPFWILVHVHCLRCSIRLVIPYARSLRLLL